MRGESDPTRQSVSASEDLTLALTDEDILAVYNRYVCERFASDDPRWAELVDEQRKKHRNRRLKQAIVGTVSSRYDRTQDKVRDNYEDSWANVSAIDLVRPEGQGVCEWRGEGALVSAPATPAVHHLLLSRSIAALRPKKVLEVGCGNGLNIMVLSSVYPDIEFHGAELTAAGVGQAKKIQELSVLPQEVQDFAADPIVDPSAHQRVEFRTASAADLPFDDDSFDLVYTSLALEQMEEVRQDAFRSVARVTRGHAAMVEPFRDFNSEGIRHDYARSRDFMSTRIADLPDYGLRPICIRDDIPNKVALGVGLVIAEKVTS
jgi:SAM-dependent methyltransferase